MTYEERKQIGEMRAAGMSYNRIADALHLSRSSVKSHCQRHGLGADRPVREARPAEPAVIPPPTTSSCEQCGGPVRQEPGRKHRRFCSDACRLAWWSAHRGEMRRNVRVIPSTVPPRAVGAVLTGAKHRVTAYARVSTDRDEQFTSYEAQIDYYTRYIKSRPDWTFVSVYADEGITGCNTNKREGFKRMVSDALAGKMDLIVTKSVSRFARNTVDSLTTIRKLKDKGVEVYFEKENIWTFDGKGELRLYPNRSRQPVWRWKVSDIAASCSLWRRNGPN